MAPLRCIDTVIAGALLVKTLIRKIHEYTGQEKDRASSNGRRTGSDSVNVGSIPAARIQSPPCGRGCRSDECEYEPHQRGQTLCENRVPRPERTQGALENFKDRCLCEKCGQALWYNTGRCPACGWIASYVPSMVYASSSERNHGG